MPTPLDEKRIDEQRLEELAGVLNNTADLKPLAHAFKVRAEFSSDVLDALLRLARDGLRCREALELLEFMCSWIVSKGFDGSTSERALPGEYDTARDLIATMREADRGPA